MCGIAGLWQPGGRVDLGRLHLMSGLLRHRGPDDEGVLLHDGAAGSSWMTLGGADTPREAYGSAVPWAPGRDRGAREDAGYALGLLHRRLSIVDLSPAGHQPMSDAEGRDWIVYNGEVYNWVELRRELEADGVRFQSQSDTEVLLAAYRRWGADCLSRFNGMFALAIWDGARRELFCARDRFGVKPFYYQHDGRTFAFASEARALVLTQPHRITPRASAIRDLLALDWVDHVSSTFFEGTWQLPPGHFMTVSPEGFSVHPWWALDPRAQAAGTAADWERRFEELFTDAVRLRLRADVEVGSCLSGGIDSSAVVTTASRLASKPIHAFSCAYDEGPAFDERPYMRATVEATGAHGHLVVPDGSDLWEVFDRLHDLQGEPTAGPGVFSQWKVMELAGRNGLKVLLDGQGADETLAGYFRYLPVRLRDLLRHGDDRFFSLFGPVSAKLGSGTTWGLLLEPWLPREVVTSLRRRFGQGKDRVLGKRLLELGPEARPALPFGWYSHLGRQLAFDTTVRQLPSLLRYEDRNSMAHSIETRLPFLDYRLVEFVFSLPDDQKLEGLVTKAIMRRSLAERVPEKVLARRDKMGFETPTDLWLRGRHAPEVRRRLLGDGPLADWVDMDALREELEGYLGGQREIGLQVWRWLALESWLRRYVATDPRRVERPVRPSRHAGKHLTWSEATGEVERDAAAGVLGG